MSSHYATVDNSITKHCPILSARDITPKALIDLEDAHNEYFIAKEINETNKVKKILGGFKCMHIHNWIASEREVLITLKYSDFMSQLQANYLPPNWKEMVCSQILSM
jgi:hypothetical protein